MPVANARNATRMLFVKISLETAAFSSVESPKSALSRSTTLLN